ncbi:MAG: hypothetical protein PHI97_26005 [Desulfobulbus sp.]|nr:hypothetical protein [Desulfobulbus sp.]
MLKRYVLSLLCLPLLLAVFLLLLSPLLSLRRSVPSPYYEQGVCLWGALALVLMIFIGNKLLKKIWFFPGANKLSSEKQVREVLLGVNTLACPVKALGKRKKIILTWRSTDPQWCGMFSRLGMERLYELHCRIDADSRTVYLVDRIRRVDFLICPDRVKTGFARICLPFLRVRSNRLETIDQYSSLQMHDYDFYPREIKGPVLGSILACGWNVRFSLF